MRRKSEIIAGVFLLGFIVILCIALYFGIIDEIENQGIRQEKLEELCESSGYTFKKMKDDLGFKYYSCLEIEGREIITEYTLKEIGGRYYLVKK